jgi:hypothetical protein
MAKIPELPGSAALDEARLLSITSRAGVVLALLETHSPVCHPPW